MGIDTQKLALIMCSPHQGLHVDQRLALAIHDNSTQAKRKDSSDLYRRLSLVNYKKENRQLVAVPVHTVETEMHQRNTQQPRLGLFMGPRYSQFPVDREGVDNTTGEEKTFGLH